MKVIKKKDKHLLVFQIQIIKERAFFQCLPAFLKTHMLYCLKYVCHIIFVKRIIKNAFSYILCLLIHAHALPLCLSLYGSKYY